VQSKKKKKKKPQEGNYPLRNRVKGGRKGRRLGPRGGPSKLREQRRARAVRRGGNEEKLRTQDKLPHSVTQLSKEKKKRNELALGKAGGSSKLKEVVRGLGIGAEKLDPEGQG